MQWPSVPDSVAEVRSDVSLPSFVFERRNPPDQFGAQDARSIPNAYEFTFELAWLGLGTLWKPSTVGQAELA